ncbi:TPA: CopC domain-containing protein YobA [Klebsiella oxytoca]
MPIIAGRALRLSLFLAGCLSAAGAFAHAHLQQQLPAAGAVVAASPQALTLNFSEGIETQFSGVTLTGPQQNTITLGKPVRMTVPVEQALTPGEYTVDWHVVSVDGHKTKGQYTFTVK